MLLEGRCGVADAGGLRREGRCRRAATRRPLLQSRCGRARKRTMFGRPAVPDAATPTKTRWHMRIGYAYSKCIFSCNCTITPITIIDM